VHQPSLAVCLLARLANGLDPDGIRWMRDLLRQLAGQGGTVLVSSHLLAEAAQTVDDVVVITRGRLAAHGPVTELADATSSTRIRTPDTGQLMSARARDGITAPLADPGTLETRGTDPGLDHLDTAGVRADRAHLASASSKAAAS
jgi:ABC-2 type transport system ATP-binding protein